jgi:hypothetical protein
MSTLEELLKDTGDEAKDLVKRNLLELIQGAKSESEAVVKETGEKIERWLVFKVKGEIDSDELDALLNARRRTVRQFLNSQEIATRARLEKVTIGLIDIALNKALDVVF